MGSEWPTVRLGDHVDACLGKMLDKNKNQGTYHPYLGNKQVRWGSFDLDDLAEMRFEDHEHERYGLRFGDLIVCEGGEPGRCALWKNEVPDMKIQKALHRIRPKAELDSTYLHYWFCYAGKFELLEPYFTGTTIKHLTGKAIAELPIPLPPLPEQKAIAHILGTLDDKIELNRRMNATLEAMAQALFKSWFVDFDPVIDNALSAGNPIPDELARRAEVRKKALADGATQQGSADHPPLSSPKSLFPAAFQFTEELGWIPEGWEVSNLQKTTSTIIDHRGKTPKKLASDWVDSGFPAISAKNIKDGKLVRKETIRFTDCDLYRRWMADELEQGDVLLTSEAPLGEKFYLAKKVQWVLSQRLFALRANEKTSGVYLYYWLNTVIAKADIDGRASGTTVQGIRQSELRQVNVLVPSASCIAAFSEACDPIMTKRASNDESVEQLTKLRDTLLPKLISGVIQI